jgi:hypothetical protein
MIILMCYLGMLGHIYSIYLTMYYYLQTLTERYILLIYITLMNDFNVIPTYNWESVLLACLYIH